MTRKVNEEAPGVLGNSVEVVADVQTLRVQLSQRLLRALAIIGLLAAVVGTYDAVIARQMWTIPTYWVAYAVIVVLTLWPKAPYVLRIWAIVALLYVMGVVDFAQDGSRGSARAFMLIVPFVTGIFLGRRANVFAILLTTLTMGGFGVAFSSGWLMVPGDPAAADASRWVSGTVVLLMLEVIIVASLNYLFPRFSETLQRSRQLTQALQRSQERLEDQVADRTRDLERRAGYLQATSEVARETATVMEDPQRLLSRVVNLISEQFSFYHAGIFLLDASREWAVLQAASSEGGQRMLARGHRLRVGAEGTVGYVTLRGVPRIALDVGEDAVFFNNPDLPETRSAITLPLRMRGEIIGALDVQSIVPSAFSLEDAEVLQALADQVAVAINNARLFQQAQESAAAERRARGELTREAWVELLRVQHTLGFTKVKDAVVPFDQAWNYEMEAAIRTGHVVTGGEANEALAVPIKVDGQTIAVLDVHLSEGEGVWTRERIELLDALAAQIGQALDRARLYEATQRRAAREQMTGHITDQMQRAYDMETLIHGALTELQTLLGASYSVVHLGTEDVLRDKLGLGGGEGQVGSDIFQAEGEE